MAGGKKVSKTCFSLFRLSLGEYMKGWWLVREGGGVGGCRFKAPEGVFHSGKLSPQNGWRSFSGWRMHASHTTAVTCLCECVHVWKAGGG